MQVRTNLIRILAALALGAAFLGAAAWGLYAGWFGKRVAVLQGLSFAPGDAVVGLDLKWSNDDPVSKRIGDFYVDDPPTLEKIGAAWVTGGPAPYFLCGYNYDLFVISKGEVKNNFSINLEKGCNTLVNAAGEAHWFKPSLIEAFERKYKKPRTEEKTFKTLASGREYLAAVRKDPRFLMDIDPEWRRFDGKFRFHYACRAPYAPVSMRVCLDLISKKIRKRYPSEEFDAAWKSYKFKDRKLADMEVVLTCKESLRRKFKLLDIEKNSWEPLEPKLRVVFKNP